MFTMKPRAVFAVSATRGVCLVAMMWYAAAAAAEDLGALSGYLPSAHAATAMPAPASLAGAPGLQCLALNVYHEARGESEQGQAAIAIVTLNRVASRRFPDTLCEVVWQSGQFSWTQDGRSDRPRDRAAWTRALGIVARVLRSRSGDFSALRRRLGDATHYHAHFVRPRWSRRLSRIERIGDHIFYRL